MTTSSTDRSSVRPAGRSISTVSATAIGVGGMMGAGLYTWSAWRRPRPGCGSRCPLPWRPSSRCSRCTPTPAWEPSSRAGAGRPSSLLHGFGNGIVSGGLNVFQFLGWAIAMGLYAAGFAGYAGDLLPGHASAIEVKGIAVGLIAVMVLVNLVGAKVVGRSETLVVAVELVILAVFVVLGLTKAHPGYFPAAGGDGPVGVLFGAGLLYVTFEGFGVVTNSAGAMRHPARQLPRAMYLALAIVLTVYVLVSTVVVLVLRLPAIDAAQGHVLAEAGQAIAGRAGFVAVGVAALLATASAVNATLFGDANLAYQVARDGQLPAVFARRIWPGTPASLYIAAGLTALVVLVFPLAAVGQMASLAFLIVYGMVSAGHLRIRGQTGARRGLLLTAVALNAALFVLLVGYTIHTGPISTPLTLIGALAFSFAFEALHLRRRSQPRPAHGGR